MKKLWGPLNLSAVFVLAFGLTTILHEGAHALTAKLFGVSPVLYHSYVSYDTAGVFTLHQLAIVMAGPILSLIQATLFYGLYQVGRQGPWSALLSLWLSIIGAIVFLGYIMSGPFFAYGDIGKAYMLLEVPPVLTYLLAGLSLMFTAVFFREVTPQLRSSIDRAVPAAGEQDQRWLTHLVLPLLGGTLMNVLVSLPVPTTMSLLFPLLIPAIMMPSAVRFYRMDKKAKTVVRGTVVYSPATPKWPLLGVLLLFIAMRLLAHGVQL